MSKSIEKCKKNNFVKMRQNVLEMYFFLVYNGNDWLIKLWPIIDVIKHRNGGIFNVSKSSY